MSKIQNIELINIRPERFSKIPPVIQYIVRKYDRVVLAGGSLRTFFDVNDIVEDFDLFFIDPEKIAISYTKSMSQYTNELETDLVSNYGFEVVFRCPAGELITLKNRFGVKIQLIMKQYYVDVEDLLDSFDFNICRFGINNGLFYYDVNGIYGVKHKHLDIHKVTYPVATTNRIFKYRQRGYFHHDALQRIFELVREPPNSMNFDVLYVD